MLIADNRAVFAAPNGSRVIARDAAGIERGKKRAARGQLCHIERKIKIDVFQRERLIAAHGIDIRAVRTIYNLAAVLTRNAAGHLGTRDRAVGGGISNQTVCRVLPHETTRGAASGDIAGERAVFDRTGVPPGQTACRFAGAGGLDGTADV